MNKRVTCGPSQQQQGSRETHTNAQISHLHGRSYASGQHEQGKLEMSTGSVVISWLQCPKASKCHQLVSFSARLSIHLN